MWKEIDPASPLRLLVNDGRRPRALLLGLDAPVDERLAEPDEARQRRLELVRDVGEEIALDPARTLHRLRHAVESGSELPDLVGPVDAHAS